MNLRNMLILTVLGLLVLGFLWVDGFITQSGWASLINGEWKLQATSWQMLKFSWPVLMLGFLIGCLMSVFVMVYLYAFANRKDNEKKEDEFRAVINSERLKAQQAYSLAEKSFYEDREALRAREFEVEAMLSENKALMSGLEYRTQEAEKAAFKAKTKLERATFTLRKLKAKQKKVSQC